MINHPLEPLSAAEIQSVVAVLKEHKKLTSHTRVIQIVLKEPPKELVYGLKEGENFPRMADVTLHDNQENLGAEAVVCLRSKIILSFDKVPGVQPSISADEMMECEQVILKNKDFRAKIIEHYGPDVNFDHIGLDIWSAGYYGDKSEIGTRLTKPIPFFKDPRSDNPFAYPIDGIRPICDLNKMAVVKINDYGKYPLPPEHFSFYKSSDLEESSRKDVTSLEIVQKDGPSFKVNGNHIEWQNWSLVVGFNLREGLTLHDVRYDGRSILYRASVADMVIPYGEPMEQHARKNAFDIGEYGIGVATNTLRLGADALGQVHFFDGELVSSRGDNWTLKDAISVTEEDYGILWKHYDRHSRANEIRRSRRLCIATYCSVENYDYGFIWYLYQDGTIEFKVNLTGFLSLGTWNPKDGYPKHGNLVAPMLYAPNHQHILGMRLDFAVDGIRNTVSCIDVVAEEPGEGNEFNNGFYAKKTRFHREKEARGHVNVELNTTWDIANESKLNAVNMPVAYRLLPHGNVVPYASQDAWWRKRARFPDYHVWVTPFHDKERAPAGKYPNQSREDSGLIKWTEKDRPIDNKDCVLWYVFGVTHIPRPEDYPVMPAAYAGFTLKPFGFFDRNPAFDVPPQTDINKLKCHG